MQPNAVGFCGGLIQLYAAFILESERILRSCKDLFEIRTI